MGRRAGAIAKRQGRAASDRHSARGPGSGVMSAGHYNFDDGRCFFCRGKKSGMRTGYLAVTGSIWWCGKGKCTRDRYAQEKVFESTL